MKLALSLLGSAVLVTACHSSSNPAIDSSSGPDPDGASATDATGETDAPASGVCEDDVFGIKMIYCTKPGGDEWFINMDDPDENLARFDPKGDITKNPDGSWKMSDTQVRMNVYTQEGYDQDLITTYDADELAAKGYMQSPSDWKNVEITAYVKVNDAGSGDDNLAWYARGGFHGNRAGDGGSGCEGTAYKGDLHYSGRTRIAKEQWHNSGYAFTEHKDAQDGSIEDRWVGFKTVLFNTAANAVQVELYADWDANNTWVKIDELLDDGGFGDEGGVCGGAADQPITWGGPIATFRWDTASDVDFRDLSVREISAP